MSKYEVAALTVAVAAALVAGRAHAQVATDQQAKGSQPKATLETIIVTGTRESTRTVADSLSPIDVLTPQDLVNTGAPDLATALRQLLPSLNFPTQSLNDQSVGSMPAQMRGLSPDDTLVLVNGKIQHHTAILNGNGTTNLGVSGGMSSPVDLNAIPMSAIARIEVLRDGAAAQYGSGAIAGVINVILKGGAGDHGSAYVNRGQYSKHGDGKTLKGGAGGGANLGENGWIHLSADYLNQDFANRAGPDSRGAAWDPAHNTVTMIVGLPKEIQKQAALNAQYNIGANATLYAFSLFNKRGVLNAGGFRFVSQYEATSPEAATVYPSGFLPYERQALLDSTTVVGLRGTVLGWDYDLSVDTGSSHWKLNTDNTFNYSLGAASPTSFYIGTLAYRNSVANVDLQRDFDVGLAGPLSVAWGIAHSREKFQEKEGDSASYFGGGAQVFPGFQPGDAVSATRTDTAEYVDIESQLTKRFSAGFAARHEHYSDFGSAKVWKISGRYEFNPTVALRGTISTGFRAPTMQQEWYATTGNQFVSTPQGIVQMTTHLFRADDPVAEALGAQPLRPEQSHNYSVGVVLTPAVGPYVTLDAYRINLRDRIIQTGVLSGPAVVSYLSSVGFPFLNGGSFYTNALSTRTTGADLVASWPIKFQSSELKITTGANWNETAIVYVAPNPPQLGLHGLILPIIDRATAGGVTNGTPRTKASIAADWTKGNWTLHGQLTRYGEWTYRNNAGPEFDETFGARLVLDAVVNYKIGPWTVSVGGINVTNTYPQRNNSKNNFFGVLQYPTSSPFGYLGAYWYAGARYSW